MSSLIVALLGATLGVGAYIFSTPLLKIYIKDSAEAVMWGTIRMSIISTLYFICGIMQVIEGGIRGLGCSLPPTIVSLIGACVFRVIWIMTIFQIPKYHTIECIYISYPISWLLTLSAHIVTFVIIYKKRKREYENDIEQGEELSHAN